MKAIKKDGYYYDPPSWKVCPECEGHGWLYNSRMYDDRYKNTCGVCKGKGRIPIHYTTEEWEAAGGILTDDTPCWQIIKQGSEVLRYMEPWGDIKQLKE